jgi:hypothetical protein
LNDLKGRRCSLIVAPEGQKRMIATEVWNY